MLKEKCLLLARDKPTSNSLMSMSIYFLIQCGLQAVPHQGKGGKPSADGLQGLQRTAQDCTVRDGAFTK